MSYGISVDVGTSYTAAAVVRTEEAPQGPQVFPLGLRAAAIPSVIFLAEDGATVMGEAAERRGLLQPERLAREFKRRVGDSVPLVMGERSVTAEDLYALMVRHVVDLAEEREGEPPATITLTHPAEWGGHKISCVRDALAGAGLAEVHLITEPEAAALSYASHQRVLPGATLAVYDLGGGTFDATILRKSDEDTFTLLGTPVGLERLGGADFDQAVLGHVLDSLPEVFADLDPADPEVLQGLARLRRECADAKEALSSDADVTVPVFLPGVHEQVRLVRSEFEALIEEDIHETIASLSAALEGAGVAAEELDAILLIGGSSRIPLVAQLLSEEFERPLAVDADPKASIALGAAFATALLNEEPAVAATEALPVIEGIGNDDALLSSEDRHFTPHHGPEGMSSNRRLGLRVALVVGAVALIGVATASATGNPVSFSAFSPLRGSEANAAPFLPGPGTSASAGPSASASPSATPGDGKGPLLDAPSDTRQTPWERALATLSPSSSERTGGSSQEKADKTEKTEGSEKSDKPTRDGRADSSDRDAQTSGKESTTAEGARPSRSSAPSSTPERPSTAEGAPARETPASQRPTTPADTTPAPTTPGPTTPADTTPVPTTPPTTTPPPATPPVTLAPTTPPPVILAPTTPPPTTPAPTTPAPAPESAATVPPVEISPAPTEDPVQAVPSAAPDAQPTGTLDSASPSASSEG